MNFVLPDRFTLTAEQVEATVLGHRYRNFRPADWTFGDVTVVGLTIAEVLTRLDDRPDLGIKSIDELVEMWVGYRNDHPTVGTRGHPWDGCERCVQHAELRATKLVLDALRELHAGVLIRDVLEVPVVYNVTADVQRGVDMMFRPPFYWNTSAPVGVQIQCANKLYEKPRRNRGDDASYSVTLLIPTRRDHITAMAKRADVAQQALQWRQDIEAELAA